jgi:rod shape determining protein RodA
MMNIKRLYGLNMAVITLICLVTAISIAMLYSAANGHWSPWALKQCGRFGVGLVILLIIASIDIRRWFAWSYGLYTFTLVLLICVETLGFAGMGAQRWLDLYFFNLQPSELMRVCLILALARYFHNSCADEIGQFRNLMIPLLMIIIPSALVLRQPDLGTAFLLISSGVALFFVAGVRWWMFATAAAGCLAAIPIGWHMLHAYQQKRVLIFLNPESDPMHAGYHVTQSKIALGSGGLWGKGFMLGTQSHLNFLPEKQTDFIFTMFCEEFGLMGAALLLMLYGGIIYYNMHMALASRNAFGRYVAIGLTSTFFLYTFVNMAMVSGLLPVVGIPLPFMSYGGTAMISLLFSQGLIFSVSLYNDVRVGR